MSIDLKKLKTTKFKDRTKDIEVEPLKDFFSKDDKPIWTVKALSGEELYLVRQAVERSRNIDELVSQLVSGSPKKKVEAALKSLGISDDLPEEYIRRLHCLRHGSAKPDLKNDVEGLEICKIIAENHAVLFNRLTDEIMALTGLGKLGEFKSAGSGTIPK